MTLLAHNQIYLKHLVIAAHTCNGLSDILFFCMKCNSLLDPEFYLQLITGTGTTSYFMLQALLNSS